MKKQNLWFLTLFSLIMILGVYYITMPSDLLKNIEEKVVEKKETVVETMKEESPLTALRVNLEEERQERLEVLQEQLINEKLSKEEKNNVYEELKYLNEIQGKEESIEKKIKKEQKLDCFLKIENTNASALCIADDHNTTMANSIMRLIQKEYEQKMNITVKFQKK